MGSATRRRSGSASKRLIFSGQNTPQQKQSQPSLDEQVSKKPPLLQKQKLTANGKLLLHSGSNLSFVVDQMSKQEMLQIIESQNKDIKHLQEKVRHLES